MIRLLPLFLAALALDATVGGNTAPDGSEIHCDLPADLHRRNTTSQGQGCCVWTSIHHAALWQNLPAIQEAPKWIQAHNIPGGAYPGAVEKYLPQMARERGGEAPLLINYEGSDLDILKLACKSGRMPGVTYAFSPTGRYGGARIAHMTNLVAAGAGKGPDGKGWWVILDNNYPGANQYEWLSEAEFKKSWTGMGSGWCVVLLAPPPPPPPQN